MSPAYFLFLADFFLHGVRRNINSCVCQCCVCVCVPLYGSGCVIVCEVLATATGWWCVCAFDNQTHTVCVCNTKARCAIHRWYWNHLRVPPNPIHSSLLDSAHMYLLSMPRQWWRRRRPHIASHWLCTCVIFLLSMVFERQSSTHFCERSSFDDQTPFVRNSYCFFLLTLLHSHTSCGCVFSFGFFVLSPFSFFVRIFPHFKRQTK